jgi:hypothetical protein
MYELRLSDHMNMERLSIDSNLLQLANAKLSIGYTKKNNVSCSKAQPHYEYLTSQVYRECKRGTHTLRASCRVHQVHPFLKRKKNFNFFAFAHCAPDYEPFICLQADASGKKEKGNQINKTTRSHRSLL